LHGATGHAGTGALQQLPCVAEVHTISSVSSQLPGGYAPASVAQGRRPPSPPLPLEGAGGTELLEHPPKSAGAATASAKAHAETPATVQVPIFIAKPPSTVAVNGEDSTTVADYPGTTRSPP
jgi:hypothetical protein